MMTSAVRSRYRVNKEGGKCVPHADRTSLIRSKDDGKTWSAPERLSINNSLGPAYAGGGLNHGIEIRNGPHTGRLVVARRFDCPAVMGDHGSLDYMRSFALFSDDQGATWTAGQLLPAGWTEDQLTEMHNGSLLMTSRLEHEFPAFQPDPNNGTDPRNRRRAFARSDDGGYTWAALWYLAERQPEIQRYVAECAHALTSDPSTATIFWGHPGGGDDGHDRSNYTLQSSSDGGASSRKKNPVRGAGHLDHDGDPQGGVGQEGRRDR